MVVRLLSPGEKKEERKVVEMTMERREEEETCRESGVFEDDDEEKNRRRFCENHKVIPGETNFAFMEMLLHFSPTQLPPWISIRLSTWSCSTSLSSLSSYTFLTHNDLTASA